MSGDGIISILDALKFNTTLQELHIFHSKAVDVAVEYFKKGREDRRLTPIVLHGKDNSQKFVSGLLLPMHAHAHMHAWKMNLQLTICIRNKSDLSRRYHEFKES